MDTLAVFRNDNIVVKDFTITDSTGAAYDLSGGTVYFSCKKYISDTTYIFNKICTITDALGGLCQVSLTTTDLAIAGTFIAEMEFRKGSEIHTLEQWKFIIAADVRT